MYMYVRRIAMYVCVYVYAVAARRTALPAGKRVSSTGFDMFALYCICVYVCVYVCICMYVESQCTCVCISAPPARKRVSSTGPPDMSVLYCICVYVCMCVCMYVESQCTCVCVYMLLQLDAQRRQQAIECSAQVFACSYCIKSVYCIYMGVLCCMNMCVCMYICRIVCMRAYISCCSSTHSAASNNTSVQHRSSRVCTESCGKGKRKKECQVRALL